MRQGTKLQLWVSAIAIFHCGCADPDRWDRYAGGGEFLGVRPSMSSDGSSIVYSTPATGHGDIYRCDAGGGHRVRLTSHPSYEGSPSFSLDGKRICFMRADEGVGHIWIMDRDGRHQKQITSSGGSDEDPSFSHDGRRIVFCRRFRQPFRGFPASGAEICVIDADGSNERRLTNNDRGRLGTLLFTRRSCRNLLGMEHRYLHNAVRHKEAVPYRPGQWAVFQARQRCHRLRQRAQSQPRCLPLRKV